MPERTINNIPAQPTPAGVWPKGTAPADAPLMTPALPASHGVAIVRPNLLPKDDAK